MTTTKTESLLDPQQWYQEEFGSVPRANELASAWVGLVENEHFARHIRMLRVTEKGFDPLPDRNSIEHLLRSAGHDFAASQVLAQGTFLRQLFRGNYICQEDFIGLYGTITARLMQGKSELKGHDVAVLYSTLDRMLRGGEEWPTITRVSAADRAFYTALSRIKIPFRASIHTPLKGLFREAGRNRFGEPFMRLHHVAGSALRMLTASVAHRHGRQQATPEDAVEAGLTYVRLFEVDPRQLPLVTREGKTGYEVAG